MGVLQYASRSVATVALVALAAGCNGDSTAPDAPFDAAGTSSDVQAVNQSFDAPALEAYAAASAEIEAVVGGAAALAVSAAPSAALTSDGKAGARRYAAALARQYRTGAVQPSFSSAAIPEEYLGATFVWDVETDTYVVSELSGAPSNGVRFLLYAVNPVTGVPVEPLVEIGYADITTSETASSATGHIIVVSGGVTYLDYAVVLSVSTSSANLSVSGYATNGNDRVNFDLETTFSGNEQSGLTLGIDYLLVVPTRGGFRIEIEGVATGILTETITTTLDLEARGDHGTVRIQGSDINGAGTYQVTVNGDLFATITVSGGAPPVIVSATGQPLTQTEQAAFLAIWAMFAEGFDFFGDVLEPLN